MIELIRKHNYRNIRLDHRASSQTVGVLNEAGTYHYFRWLGFIERNRARTLSGAIPVKLEVHGYSKLKHEREQYVLDVGQHVQGCVVQRGVYAVTVNGLPRIV